MCVESKTKQPNFHTPSIRNRKKILQLEIVWVCMEIKFNILHPTSTHIAIQSHNQGKRGELENQLNINIYTMCAELYFNSNAQLPYTILTTNS